MGSTSIALLDVGQCSPRPVLQADRRIAIWLFVLVAAGFLLVQEGAITGYDGRTMYGVTEAMIERGTLAVDPELNTLPGRGGQEYSRYGLGLSLLAAVPYLVVRPLAVLAPDPVHVLEAAVASTMPLVMGGLAAALFLLAHAVDIGLPHAEMPTTYRSRASDSKRKLRTVRDGLRILAKRLVYLSMPPVSVDAGVVSAVQRGPNGEHSGLPAFR